MADPKITITAVDQTKAAFASVATSLDRLKTTAAGFSSVFAGLGAGLSAGALVAFAKSGIDAADDLGKLSQKVGVTVESLSALQYAAKLSDVSNEQLATGLARLARAASDAGAGSKETAEAFQAIGVAVKDSQGNLRGTEELLLDIADRFEKMEDGAGKTAIAMRLFGRAGADLIPFLNAGRSGFEELRKEAERLGIVLSKETAKAAEDFNDNMTRLGTQVDRVKFALAEGALPALTKIAQAMADAAKQGGALQSVMAGIQTLLTGDDLHKANVELTKLTDEMLSTEAEIARKAGKASREEVVALEEHLDRLRQRIGEVQRYRSLLSGETNIFGEQKAQTPQKKDQAPTLQDSSAIKAAAAEVEKAERERQRLIKLGNDEWVRHIDEQIEMEKELAEAAHKTAEQRFKENEELRKKDIEGWIKYADAVFEAADEENLALAKIAEEANKTSDVARELGLTFSSAFEDAAVAGKGFGDVLKGLAQDLARLVLRESVTKPLAQAGTKLFDNLNLGKIFGFATGGSFQVGGSGGTDSQLVAFKASPNERVTIETPEQQRQGRGAFSQTINIDARGADAGVEQKLRVWGREIMAQTLQAVQAQADRGGNFARAVGRR